MIQISTNINLSYNTFAFLFYFSLSQARSFYSCESSFIKSIIMSQCNCIEKFKTFTKSNLFQTNNSILSLETHSKPGRRAEGGEQRNRYQCQELDLGSAWHPRAPRRPQCNCETVEFMHKRCIPPFQEILIKIEKKKTQTNDKLSWVPAPSWVPINSPACPAGCVTSLEQYPVAGSMSRCSEPARHITSLLTKTSDRGVRRRSRQLPGVVNTSASHSLAQISPINFMPVRDRRRWKKCQVPVKRVWEQPPAMPGHTYTLKTNQISVRSQGCGIQEYICSRPCLTHPEETRQRMKASRDVWPAAGGPSLETQFMQFYIEDIVTV